MGFRQVFQQVFAVQVALASLVFVLVALALVVALVRRRAGAGRAPSPRSRRKWLERAYLVVLIGVAAFLVVFTARANARDHERAGPGATTVQVNAFQWCWQFQYVDQPVTVDGQCQVGQYPTLVVPTGRPIRLLLRSRDVVHSFWVPDLDVKMDVFPDHTNTLTLSFTRPGRWLGRCAEYCGTYHVTMDFYLRAVSPDQYQQWLAQSAHAGHPA